MCGLTGRLTYLDAHQRGPTLETERQLLNLAARRGPDDERLWGDEHCVLGHRRLSVLDLSSKGRQPMHSRDGRYVIVFNGLLYNFRELRRELEGTGVRFRSTGDTEVVLYSLARWGTEALGRFNGMFALGFYDTRERRLLLARDHAGMKPLYYLEAPTGVLFASQFDQIRAHPWCRGREVSSDARGLYLRLGHVPAPYAWLQGSHLLEAGCWLTVDAARRLRRGRFFEFPRYRDADLSGDEADEAVGSVVRDAVQRHLVADVPMGVLLSGGIDSPLVAASMRCAVSGPLPAFTVATGGDAFDESADAACYAGELGLDHTIGDLSAEGAFEMVDEVVSACPEPLGDYSIFPTLQVSRLASRKIKVALSGDGGDELFWGYAGRFGTLLRRLQEGAPKGTDGWGWDRLLSAGRSGADPRWPTSIGDLQRLKHTHRTEGWLRRIFPDLPPWPDGYALFRYDGRDAGEVAQWLRWNEFHEHLAMILQKVDRASMFHSLEVRAPLLDREVIEVATRVDWRSCLDPERGLGKLPLRRALARHVRHQTMAKRGFTVPMDAWLRGPLRPVFEKEVLCLDGLAGLGVDRQAVHEAFQRHLRGEVEHGWNLWVLLSLALWESRH